ncbi:MAG: hypothetical protein HQK79_02985 [Desulfobacterales bacterium]|nr:hypothetical protein [Desulfobacterales bacterium]MBF0398419.1 hypothetical protein [Desulfobacterales bacterium]
MALDEPKNTDNVYNVDGFSYLIDKAFLDKIKSVKVDFLNSRFQLTSEVVFWQTQAGGCPSAGGGCSC